LPIYPLFKPFRTTADIVNSDGNCVQVQMLGDTNALQSVLKESVCDESHYRHTVKTRLIKGISNKVLEIPLVELHVRTNLMDKDVLCGMVSELPDGVDFLLSNDLDSNISPEYRYLEESVITRAQAASQKLDLHHHNTNHDKHDGYQHTDDQHHVHEQLDEQTDADHHDVVPANDSNASLDKDDTPLDELLNLLKRSSHKENNDLSSIHSREQFIALQKHDRSLATLFKDALVKDFPNAKPYFYLNDDMLMHHEFESKTYKEADQIVVPQKLRSKILYLAHAILDAGHLGMTETTARLWPHFYWPRISKHIYHYCIFCDRCQRVGKRHKPGVAPLMPLPVMTEP